MDIDKKMEMLRKRNAKLQEENETLKAQLSQQSNDKDRYKKLCEQLEDLKARWEKELCEQLEDLKARWEKEVADIKDLKIKYETIISDIKKAKDILMGK